MIERRHRAAPIVDCDRVHRIIREGVVDENRGYAEIRNSLGKRTVEDRCIEEHAFGSLAFQRVDSFDGPNVTVGISAKVDDVEIVVIPTRRRLHPAQNRVEKRVMRRLNVVTVIYHEGDRSVGYAASRGASVGRIAVVLGSSRIRRRPGEKGVNG